MKYVVKDKQGRALITINDNGKMIVSRYVGLSAELKEYMVSVFKNLTIDGDKKETWLRHFLDFKTGEDEFCS